MPKPYRALRGLHDILPDAMPHWHWVEDTTRRLLRRYGFREMRTPLLESTELFARSVGEGSDLVRKEMYSFRVGDDSYTLRPENTASVVRAFVEHSLHREVGAGYPERYFYLGAMFRHERPQKGRQRQFHQVGVELLGAAEPLADAETIEMADRLLGELGIAPREMCLASVGDEACRPAFRQALDAWLVPRIERMCEDCQRRARDNPLRVFDCKVEGDRELLRTAPTMHSMLCDDCRQHLAEVGRLLDEYGVAWRADERLVRGLDYYRRTVFEVVSPALGAQNAILGGGRYDRLVEELGGPPMPAFGFALGLERLIALLDPARVARERPDVALIGLGDEGFRATIRIAQRLRHAGVAVLAPLVARPMGQQLRRADRAGARLAVFVGAAELARGSFAVKDLRSGEQVELDETRLAELARREVRDA